MTRQLAVAIALIYFVSFCYSASVTYNQIDDIRMTYDGKVFVCDKITCPENTLHCIVTKKTLPEDKTKIDRWARCLGEGDKILLEDRKTENNPGNANVNIIVEQGMNGVFSTYNNENVQKQLQQTLIEVEQNLQNLRHNIRENLEKQLANFGRIF